jgi:hypothetical protein
MSSFDPAVKEVAEGLSSDLRRGIPEGNLLENPCPIPGGHAGVVGVFSSLGKSD